MARSRNKSKTLRNHRKSSTSTKSTPKTQKLAKREQKEQKQAKRASLWYNNPDLTLKELRKELPGLHTREALAKLAELRGD